MIHEIAPYTLDNQYKPLKPEPDSTVIVFYKRKLLVSFICEKEITLPAYSDLKAEPEVTYLFAISGKTYFLLSPHTEEEAAAVTAALPGYTFTSWPDLRDITPRIEAFALMTAMHLAGWYASVTYCGCCGTKAVHDRKERMMRCPSCNNMMFPKISPAIIVAVTDGERLLLTRYAGPTGHNYALVAGFIEIGETAEECVAREVMEETGIEITDIKYYGTQPWGYVGNLMMGYTARLNGSHKISLDENELAEAVWLKPEEIPDIEDYSSLTREMIRRFKHGELFKD